MQSSKSRCGLWAAAVLLATLIPGGAQASELEDRLSSRWKGSWVVIQRPISSDCGDLYTNNRIEGDLVADKGRERFAAGELGRIAKVDLKRARLDLLVDLAEPILIPFSDGPFDLVEEASCRVELQIVLPRSLVKSKDGGAIEAEVAAVVERFSSEQAAVASSEGWNERHRGELPPDHEERWAAYREWKAARVNDEVAERVEQASREARTLSGRIRDDADYLQGFADGLRKNRYATTGACDTMLSSGPTSYPSPSGSGAYRDGNEDGQRLGYLLRYLEAVAECYVPTAAGG